MAGKGNTKALAYLRTSSAANAGADKDAWPEIMAELDTLLDKAASNWRTDECQHAFSDQGSDNHARASCQRAERSHNKRPLSL
jgi:hypothetical protein